VFIGPDPAWMALRVTAFRMSGRQDRADGGSRQHRNDGKRDEGQGQECTIDQDDDFIYQLTASRCQNRE
jgi:hypothetical protein